MSSGFLEFPHAPAALRISKRNKLLREQVESEDIKEAKQLAETQAEIQSAECTLETASNENLGCIMLDCDTKNCLLIMMHQFQLMNYYSSDFETIRCKQVYRSILDKDPNSPQANFGLCKLYAFEKNLDKALEYASKSCEGPSSESLYLLWKIMLMIFHQKEYNPKSPVQYLGILCTSRSKPDKQRLLASLSEQLLYLPNCLEKWWCYLELSIKKAKKLEVPEYYASRLIESDKYVGYLAWARLLQDTKVYEAEKLLKSLIAKYPKRYEAYLILWRIYHYTLRDYNAATGIIEQAFLKAACNQNVRNLIVIAYSKSLYKRGNILSAAEILIHSYMSHTEFPAYLTIYGKICIKSAVPEVLSSGLSALLEAYKQCGSFRKCSINYWIGKAYLIRNEVLDSLVYFSKALDTIENSSSSKGIKISKIISKHFQVIEIYERAEDRLRRRVYDELETLCRLLKDHNVYMAEMIRARAYWEEGKKDEAVQCLQECSKISSCKLEAHWLIMNWLIKQKKFDEASEAGLEMIHICNDKNVLATDWVKSHLFYSNFLEKKNSDIGSAMLILKCIGKAFPNLPYIQLPYVYRLRNAQSAEELMKVVNEDEMVHQSLCSLQPQDLMRRILKIKQSESRFHLVRHWDPAYIYSHQLDHLLMPLSPQYTSASDSCDFTSSSMTDRSETLNTLLSFEQFSLCSDESFLYQIGKLCSRYKVYMSEGLLALSDYITIQIWKHSQTSLEKDYAICRAEYLKALILYNKKDYTDAWEILKRITPKLYEGKDTKICERAQNLMIKMVNMQLDSLGKVE
jgi:tetratricopeptide (TPR) repeat protein